MPTEDPLAAARRLDDEGFAAFKRGEEHVARRLHGESLDHARAAEDATAIVTALAGLMRLALRSEDWSELERLRTEAATVAADAGDDSLLRMPIHMGAEGARMRGDLDGARRQYLESIELNTRLGRQGMVGVESGNLAWVEIAAGNLAAAGDLVERCATNVDMEDPYLFAFVELTRARVLLERGDRSGRDVLAGAVQALQEAGLVWDPAEQQCFDETAAITLDG